ncbi:hypothetical protein DEO72_LG10g2296 [Vigna unguiculata]|uniref:Uncharacterized protein n=1 Tax=Vigna unguiculata TaxID=3917 RepID=A0A4D6NB68_VIGUN|nr:hypothetical protein DEO72_LG10g2296 [Vigna unguiculata]
MKELGCALFYNEDWSTKFTFIWTNNPRRYKGVKKRELFVDDRQVVEVLGRFSDKLPSVREITKCACFAGHMAQLRKKINLFRSLCKEHNEKAKNMGNTKVPNLQEPLVEVRVNGISKRKTSIHIQKGIGKDMKRVNAKLLGSGLTSRIKKLEACLRELPETLVRRDIEINLPEVVISSIDNMEHNAMIKAMSEFNNKALILGCRVGNLLHKELKEGGRAKVEEIQEELKTHAAKHEEEKAA